MTIQKRRCASCAHFNQAQSPDEPMCWNLVPIDKSGQEVCAQHRTSAEEEEYTSITDLPGDLHG